ncbi:MAG: simple sugar transport system permease protein [Spirochaetes bacterium]|nr:MAG: simple sugar transport system permease protein [Spirochaetota bacterium]
MSESVKSKNRGLSLGTRKFLTNNVVTILFVLVGLGGLKVSGLSIPFFLDDIINRVARNGFMVLALIIPVLAGLGLNFAVVLGAMAGQTAIIMATHWGFGGIGGILLCVVLSFPFAYVMGLLTGKLLNKTRGKEMITTLILGFFANGIYQLVYLILIGTIIPMNNEVLVLSSGVGLRTTIDLTDGLKFGLDNVVKIPLTLFSVLAGAAAAAGAVIQYLVRRRRPLGGKARLNWMVAGLVFGIASMVWGVYQMLNQSMFSFLRVPAVTFAVIVLLCWFIHYFTKTKLGQDMRTVGQDSHVADVAGIATDKIRVTAMIMSTVLAAWGQIIFLQNMGTFSTYGSHENVGMFAIASLLIGGASVAKATISQALIGTVLFHTMFIVSPLAGRVLFGDAQLGEFFRSFVAYGIIGLSLALHSWKKRMQGKLK